MIRTEDTLCCIFYAHFAFSSRFLFEGPLAVSLAVMVVTFHGTLMSKNHCWASHGLLNSSQQHYQPGYSAIRNPDLATSVILMYSKLASVSG